MRVLISECDGFSPVAVQALHEAGAEVQLCDLDRDGLLRELASANVLWCRLRHRIDPAVLQHGPRLRVIATATTGLDHIDCMEADRRGIEVVSLRGETAFLEDIRATSEHTIGLMLAWLRNLPAAADHARSGHWSRDRFRGGEIAGRTVGLVGYGRLGRLVARTLLAFGAQVLATDPFVPAEAFPPEVTRVGFRELLHRSDIVSLHVPLQPNTVGLIGGPELAAMKPGALLVNTSRGEVLDEGSVLAALDADHLGGLAADVLAGESSDGMADHALVRRAAHDPRVLLTPHIGGATWESMRKTEDFLAGRVLEAMARVAPRR